MVLAAALVLVYAGCAATPAAQVGPGATAGPGVQEEPEGTEGIPLAEAIEQSAKKIAADLPGGSRVAIVGFSSEHANLSEYIMDELTGALDDNDLEVADRRNLAFAYKEAGFQASGEVDEKTAVSIGKFLGAPYVVFGQLVNAGSSRRYRLAGVNVETAVQESSTRLTVRDDRAFRNLAAAMQKAPVVTVAANYGETGSTAPKTAGAFFDRAMLSKNQGEYDNAIADYTEALRLDPDFTAAYNNRGNAYDDKGMYDRAIEDYNKALRIDPNYAAAYYNRGIAYKNKGMYDRAIEDYNKALRIDPNYAAAYNNRGYAYDDKGMYDRAIEDYNKALRIDPNDAAAYNNRGVAYNNKGMTDRAIEDYNAALRLDPNYSYAYNNRGIAYKNKKDYRRARADYEKALQLDPNNTAARNNLELLRNMGY
jgi:tetratricopeptide (TPR) repeat protein